MTPNYSIIRFRALKRHSLRRCDRHNRRLAREPHVDESRSHLNHDFFPEKQDVSLARRVAAKLTEKSCAEPSRGKVIAVEALITISREVENPQQFADDAAAFCRAEFGDDLVAMHSHRDEAGATHVHAVFVPIVSTSVLRPGPAGKCGRQATQKNVCSYAAYFSGKARGHAYWEAGKQKRASYQTRLAVALSHHGVVRGEVGTRRSNLRTTFIHARNASIDDNASWVTEQLKTIIASTPDPNVSPGKLLTKASRHKIFAAWKQHIAERMTSLFPELLRDLVAEAKKGAQLVKEIEAKVQLGRRNNELRVQHEQLKWSPKVGQVGSLR